MLHEIIMDLHELPNKHVVCMSLAILMYMYVSYNMHGFGMFFMNITCIQQATKNQTHTFYHAWMTATSRIVTHMQAHNMHTHVFSKHWCIFFRYLYFYLWHFITHAKLIWWVVVVVYGCAYTKMLIKMLITKKFLGNSPAVYYFSFHINRTIKPSINFPIYIPKNNCSSKTVCYPPYK